MNISNIAPIHRISVSPLAAVAPQSFTQGVFQGSLQGFQLDPALLNQGINSNNLSRINSDFLGVSDQSAMAGGGSDGSMASVLQGIIDVLGQMIASMQGGQGSQFLNPGFGQFQNGNGGGAVVPAGGSFTPSAPSGGGGPIDASSVSPSSAPPAPANTNAASPVNIGPGTRVLEIGDSHSVGTFGKELDAKLRGTGAQVSTYASAGATASTFVQGKSTNYGYWEKGADGQERSVNYGKSAQTPRLENLIAKDKPQVILVNLGANFRGGNPKSQVDQIGQIAKKHGIPIVWVGPPKTAKDNSNPGSLAKFDQEMAAAVAPYGTYVSSNRHTPKYSGGDGLHYSGSQGNQIAKQWASGVFGDITGR